MNFADVTRGIKANPIVVIGTLAGAAAAWFLLFRKTPVPIVNVTAPAAAAPSTPTSDVGTSLDSFATLANTQAGAITQLQNLLGGLTTYSQPTTAPVTAPVDTTTPISTPTPIQAPPVASPSPPTTPPPATTAPVYSGALHTATATGAAPYAWLLGNPSTQSKVNQGAVFSVVQVNLDGAIWWEIETSGPNLGMFIRYHDPAWSVSP